MSSPSFVRGAPAPPLAPYIREYVGYHERTDGPLQRREMPAAQIVMIIDLGPTIGVRGADGAFQRHEGGFVAGLDDVFAVTEMPGEQSGIQVNLLLAGAHRVLGLPPSELIRQVVRFDEVFGGEGRRLLEALGNTPDWALRFALLDGFFATRVGDAPPPADWLAWACRQIEDAAGALTIGELSAATGFSRKHVAGSFRQRFGMTPKALARLVRFAHVLDALRDGHYRTLTDVAVDCGYFDQAHFIREFRRFTGYTPGEFAAVTFVQSPFDATR